MQNQGCSNYHESREGEFWSWYQACEPQCEKIIHAAGGYISEKGSHQVIYPRRVNNYRKSRYLADVKIA
jgi:hypothetical protein